MASLNKTGLNSTGLGLGVLNTMANHNNNNQSGTATPNTAAGGVTSINNPIARQSMVPVPLNKPSNTTLEAGMATAGTSTIGGISATPVSSNIVVEDLSTSINKILTKNLPETLTQLSDRHENFQKIANYLEGEYISARRSGVEDQTTSVLKESKVYLTQSLIHFVNDLSIISTQFDQLLTLEANAIDSLSCQNDLLKSRIFTSKNQRIYNSLDEMQIGYQHNPHHNNPNPINGNLTGGGGSTGETLNSQLYNQPPSSGSGSGGSQMQTVMRDISIQEAASVIPEHLKDILLTK